MQRVSFNEIRPVTAVRRRSVKAPPIEEPPMFTGIVEQSARVLHFAQGSSAWSLDLRAAEIAEKVRVGDSVSVNGVCLTVASIAGKNIRFDVLEETRRVTNLNAVVPGSIVNVERSLKVGGRMGGHFVTGHVDGLGSVLNWEQRGADWFLKVRPPADFLKYIVYKGSIAINGISLTVAEVDAEAFAVWIIPHTREVTNLNELKVGDQVNLECDMLAKYAEKLLFHRDTAVAVPQASA
jgi:riboflavin synthase